MQKRKLKRGKNAKRGSRDIKGMTARRAAAAEQNVSRNPKHQQFPRRMMGANPRATTTPLRLRDPIAYQRKLANERMARQQGALPRQITAHRGAESGLTDTSKVQTFGMKGTKMPNSPNLGTSLSRFKKPKGGGMEGLLIHDPLGGDPLKMAIAKRAGLEIRGGDLKGLNRSELLELKNNVKKLVQMLDKLKKSTPEVDYKAKRGSNANEERATAPTGPTEVREEDKAYRFTDLSSGNNGHLVGKK